MQLTYEKLSKKPLIFLRLTGLKVNEFTAIVEKVRPLWEIEESKKKSYGRLSHLPTLEDKVLCVCVYYRTYIIPEVI